ncbi:hypothetical protein JVU11DRAFT_2003 [Chiua virens]|nr:hypothetical protein JVU11DRAFT_2003 [Chiua virens]
MYDDARVLTDADYSRDYPLALAQCSASYKITPFDRDFYQDCVDEAVRRGHPMEGDYSVRSLLATGC